MANIPQLHEQLKEVQGALQRREQEFRQLKTESMETTRAYSNLRFDYDRCSQTLEANKRYSDHLELTMSKRIHELEEQIATIRSQEAQPLPQPATPDESRNDTSEVVTLTHTETLQAEERYQQVRDELAQAKRQCENLQVRLDHHAPRPCSDEEIKTFFEDLVQKVQHVCHHYFNRALSRSLIDDNEHLFSFISGDYSRYLTEADFAPYIFQRIVWDYLDRSLLGKPTMIWGHETHDAIEHLTKKTGTAPMPVVSARAWKTPLVNLLHQVGGWDEDAPRAVGDEILAMLLVFVEDMEDADVMSLKKDIDEVVRLAARISSIMISQEHRLLLTERPGSERNYGFAVDEAWMNVKCLVGSGDLVDLVNLVIAPALLKCDGSYTPLVKAEVVAKNGG